MDIIVELERQSNKSDREKGEDTRKNRKREKIILKGEVSLYHWPAVWLVWNQLYDNWQFLFLFAKQTNQTGQTGGQLYSDTSFFSIPWIDVRKINV